MSNIEHWYAHVDLDAFFASVEQLDHPEYKGKPVIVGGRPEDRRGVVSTASYEARKFGVHSAMPTFQAYKLCPEGIFVHGNHKRYSELSYQIMQIFNDFSPEVLQMSIDEAFIDLTGTEKLFGEPIETCKKIKERVKKETGLTVSIGLAQTKYLAKIASGYQKPNGLFCIEPGTETDFMLNLPLEKVWGVGNKTLQNLHQKGIFTTRDIYEKDIPMLEFLFGKNTAEYLYDVVRGGKNVQFGKESKNHSLSSERTFPYDISDTYTLETQIMELAQEVMFRLLKEQGYSRTAFLKLRYDDFSTCSIQRTMDSNILTLDSLNEILKQLLEEKYQKGRGIRLIGVGFENITNEERPYQQSLFEDSTKKKQQVEKAILKLHQKHPEIKVQKARTLKSVVLFLAFLFSFSSFNKLSAFENKEDDLFSYKITGYWLADFATSLRLTYGNDFPTAFSTSVPVFKQEVELNTLINLGQNWYFDANFSDFFTNNTYTAGYKNGNYLDSAKISNRNIGFETEYSADYFGYGLKNGKNQAPGISFQLKDAKNNRWKADALIRYDLTQTRSIEFSGLNSVSTQYINTTDFIYGNKFVIPEESKNHLGSIKNIYVESNKGTYKDKYNKKYVKLSTSQYKVFQNSGIIQFSNDSKTLKENGKQPAILITFYDDSSVTQIINSTGTYEDALSFAGKIQAYFNTSDQVIINLSDFSYNYENKIDGAKALVLQNSFGFSPYLVANIYDCGTNNNLDLSLVHISTSTTEQKYKLVEINKESTLLTDFYYEKHKYAQLLSSKESDYSLQNPQNRFPLASINPYIYLTQNDFSDLKLQVKNYNSVSALNIGTAALGGTVQVYVNGVLDSGAKYNSDTGEVTLSSSVHDTDKIIVIFQEDSQGFSNGFLAAGTGILYNLNDNTKLDATITTRWPVTTSQTYATVESPLNGYAAITGGVNYKNENLQIKDYLAVSTKKQNTTDSLLVLENSDNINKTYYLSANSGKQTKELPVINDKNLYEEKNYSEKTISSKTDSYINGYAIPLKWNFGSETQTKDFWASIDINLSNGHLLMNSSELEFAFKPELEDYDYEVYLQLGITAGSDENDIEKSNKLPTWNITKKSNRTLTQLDLQNDNWQTVKIRLTDKDRALLTSTYDARLIVIKISDSDSVNKGCIYAGPYEPVIQNVYTAQSENILVQNASVLGSISKSSKELKIQKNYSVKIDWNVKNDSSSMQKDYLITTSKYFNKASFAQYRYINFDFAYITDKSQGQSTPLINPEKVLTFILDSNASKTTEDGDIAVKIELKNLNDFINEQLTFHTLKLDLETNKLYLDDRNLASSEYSLYLNKNIAPSRLKLVINTINDDKLYKNGSFYINNLYYTETKPYADFQNHFYTKYSYEKPILKIKDFDVLKNAEITVSTDQTYSTLQQFTLDNSLTAKINLMSIDFQNDLNTKYSLEDNIFDVKNAGHKFSTTEKLLKTTAFTEDYRFDKENKTLSKTDSISFDFTELNFPISFAATLNAKDNYVSETQNIVVTENFKQSFKGGDFTFNTNYKADQNIKNDFINKTNNNYFDGYQKISNLEFSTGKKSAATRNIGWDFNTGFNFNKTNIAPDITYSMLSNYSGNIDSSTSYLQNLTVKVPFKISKNEFSVNYYRESNDILMNPDSNNYFGDNNLLFKNINERSYFIKSIPFAELFTQNFEEQLSLKNTNYSESAYTSRYEFQWKHGLYNSRKDFFIPSAASFAVERSQKLTTVFSDDYLFKAGITNTAVNTFGTDEFTSTISGTVKIPSDNPSSYLLQISTFNQYIMFIKQNDTLSTSVDFQLDTHKLWNAKNNFLYTRKTNSSFIVDLAKWIVPKASDVDFIINQTENFSIYFGKNSTQFFHQYSYNHDTSISFLNNFSVNAGAGVSLLCNEKTANSLIFDFNIGGKMQF